MTTRTTLLIAAPALVLTLYTAGGIALALRAPDLTPAAEDASAESAGVGETRGERQYLRFRLPLTASMPSLGGTLSVTLAIVLAPDTPQALRSKLMSSPDAFAAPLTGVMQTTGEALPEGSSFNDLRPVLAPALADDLNDRLQKAGFDRHVLEVLFTEVALAG
jgi:hypothetical protein